MTGAEPPLRVMYVNHCAKLSGGELALLRLVGAIDGVRPVAVLAEDGPLVARLRSAGIEVDVVPIAAEASDLHRGSVRPGRLPLRVSVQWVRYTVALAVRIRRSAPDVVHTNSLKAAVYGSVAGRLAGVPVVCHIRDRIAPDYLPASAVRMIRLVVGVLADGVLANSASTLATLEWAGRAMPSEAVPDPVPPLDIARVPAPELRIGMVGRISAWKGQDVFLRAFAEAFPDGGPTATVVGAALFGEDDFGRELRRLSTALGLDGRVSFTGFRDDVGAELARMDVLVHASVIPEPFGMVVVEGMAAGLAVVASDAGGPAEVLSDGVTGLLTPPGDVGALAGALRRLADSPELRDRLGRAARVKSEEFLPAVAALGVTAFYRRVLGARRRSLRQRLRLGRPA